MVDDREPKVMSSNEKWTHGSDVDEYKRDMWHPRVRPKTRTWYNSTKEE
jgi:hypothetical protein